MNQVQELIQVDIKHEMTAWYQAISDENDNLNIQPSTSSHHILSTLEALLKPGSDAKHRHLLTSQNNTLVLLKE